MRVHRYSTIVSLLIGLSGSILAQEMEWSFLIGGSSTDRINGLITDSENNVYVTGGFESTVDFDPDVSGNLSITSNGSLDIFLAKYDSTGALSWAIGVGGSEIHNTHGDIAEDIALDSNGNIYITGHIGGDVDFDPSENEAILFGLVPQDFFIAKYDNEGNYLWAHRGGSSYYESSTSNSIVIDGSDNAVITGRFNRRITIGSYSPDVGFGNVDAFLAKYSAAGTVIWATSMGGPEQDDAKAVVSGISDDVYVMGDFYGPSQFGNSTLIGGQYNNVFIVKVTSDGNVEWAKEIVSPGSATGKDLAIDQYENLYVTGDYYQTLDADPGVGTHTLLSNGDSDIFFVSLDPMGAFRWGYSIGGTGVDYIYGLGTSSQRQELCLTGRFTGELDTDPTENLHTLTSAGAEDAFLSAYSLTGDFRWAVSFEDQGSNTDQGTDVVYDSAGNLICTGSISGSVDFDPQTSLSILSTAGSEDAYIAKLTGLPLNGRISMILNVPTVYSSIQLALGDADSLDVVLVQPGTYYENIIWPQANGIKLISDGDSSNTIIDGGGLTSVILFNPQAVTIDSATIIRDFMIRNGGNAYYAGGITLLGASPTISNLMLAYNAGERGGAIYMVDCNSSLSAMNIHNNSSVDDGGGISIYTSNPILREMSISHNTTPSAGGGIYADHSTLSINDIIILHNSASEGGGVYLDFNTSVDMTNLQVVNNSAYQGGGFGFRLNDEVSISGVSVINNSAQHYGGGIYIYGGSTEIAEINLINNHAGDLGSGMFVYHNNDIHSMSSSNIQNNGEGIYSDYDMEVPNNYWGHSSGPYHPSQNQIGQGDSVNTYLNVTPWLTSPVASAPPIPAQNVSVSGTGNDFINLDWDSSPLGDFAGYKLYYDNDESGYPYENSIDVGSNTSYGLSGLNLGTEYFLAVTVYDTDGDESWYSNEVTGVTRVMEVQNLDIAGDEEVQHVTDHVPSITWDYFDSMDENQTHYHIEVSTLDDFSTLDMWDSGFVNDNTTTVQYTGSPLLDGIIYYLRVRVASSGFRSEWAELSFRMNTEPTTPQPLSPINDLVASGEIVFLVDNSLDSEGDALTYNFHLYEDEELTISLDSAISVIEGEEQTYWMLEPGMEDNARYWWTAQSYDGFEYSALAGPESFLVNNENDAPQAFSTLHPAESGVVSTLMPQLNWESSFDPDPIDMVNYVIYLDTPDPGVTTISVGADTSYQIVSNLQDNTTYYWKVVASDLNGASTESTGGYQSFRVNTENDLPTAFELLAPVNGAMVTTLTPEFLWEAPSDPDDDVLIREITGYDLFLGTNPELTVVEPIFVTGNNFTPVDPLVENTMYFWAVIAHDDSGSSVSSDTTSFWTNAVNSSPMGFSLVSPAENQTVETINPTFSWGMADDADLFDEVVYNIFMGPSIEEVEWVYTGLLPYIMDTVFTLIEPIEDNTTYYWTVEATDTQGATTNNMEGFVPFTVNLGNDSPSAAELISPDSIIVLTDTPTFAWHASTDRDPLDSVSYEVHWWYEGGEWDSVLTDETSVIAPNSLIYDNVEYFWEVISMDTHDGIAHSEINRFWADFMPEVPGSFSLVEPDSSSAGNATNPMLSWTEAIDPDPFDNIHYWVTVASDSLLEDVIYQSVAHFEAHYVENELTDDSRYYWQITAIDEDSLLTESVIWTFDVGYVAVDNSALLPEEFTLEQNFPNPFNPSTTLRYGLPEDSEVSLIIYDIQGRIVKTFDTDSQSAGWYEQVWNGLDDTGNLVSTGLYFTRLQAGDYSKTIKMIYLK